MLMDPEQRMIYPLVAVGVYAHRFRHYALDLIDHHAKLPAMPPLISVLRKIIEQVETETERMIADADDVFFDVALGGTTLP